MDISQNLLPEYIALNNSFKKKLVFRLGADSGFFSEYNNMVLGMLYCLKHKIRFVLNSNFANFKIEQGYTDFFTPFCEEDSRWIHDYYNYRPHMQQGRRQAFTAQFLKHLYQVDYLTQDLWDFFHERVFEKETFAIPELGISGNLLDATQVIINNVVWKYNEEVSQAVTTITAKLKLPENYVGLHIRAGDKFMEGEILSPSLYMTAAMEQSDCRNAFILTDDYAVIRQTKTAFPDWKLYTLCREEEAGFSNAAFVKATPAFRKEKMVNLFASMDILASAEKFIGTFSSNPGMFLGMRMGQTKCVGMDLKEWLIW